MNETMQYLLELNQKTEMRIKELDKKKLKLQDSIAIENEKFIPEIVKLPYRDFKEVYETIKYKLSNQRREELYNKLQVVKANEYMELKKAHYYPILNNLGFSQDKINNIDSYLRMMKLGSWLYPKSGAFYDLKLTGDETNILLKYINDNNIIETRYEVVCPNCGENTGQVLTDDKISKMRRRFEIEKILSTNISQEESDELDSEWENILSDISFEFYCDDCDDWHKEITNENDFNNLKLKEVYIKIASADLTYESL